MFWIHDSADMMRARTVMIKFQSDADYCKQAKFNNGIMDLEQIISPYFTYLRIVEHKTN